MDRDPKDIDKYNTGVVINWMSGERGQPVTCKKNNKFCVT
jgi:hypothetical protein